jgi:hypothetical protein
MYFSLCLDVLSIREPQILSQKLPGGTEENHKNLSEYSDLIQVSVSHISEDTALNIAWAEYALVVLGLTMIVPRWSRLTVKIKCKCQC